MGVKDLWQVLAPVCERKSLWDLQDKTVAIDLSGWVCDSQNIVEHSAQPNMHLRNLFFRTSCLLLLGARPVFVLEGDAPDLKINVMSQRNAARGLSRSSKNSGKRTRYKGIQKKCQEMLKTMGVHCVQSPGEAEALCAKLNARGMVDGCISQDSDCFLYGGRVVYRNFTISASSGGGGGAGFSIDMYRMEQIEELLGLTRTKLIGLSLLCGCDYNQKGVSGVGKETAVKFLVSLRDSEVFTRFRQWRNDPLYEQLENERSFGVCDRCNHLGKRKVHDKSGCDVCGTSKSCLVNSDISVQRDPEDQKNLINELNIRKKALQDETFPSQDVIDEFSCIMALPEYISAEWHQPNLIGFMKLAEKNLNWDECYSLEKFLPLLTRWLILQKKNTAKCPIYPEAIVKTRVLKGVASYEVRWADTEGLFDTLLTEEGSDIRLTIEPRELFDKAFPNLVQEFNEMEAIKKAAKQKGKTKTTKSVRAPRGKAKCSDCGGELPAKNQKCMCHFVKISSKETERQVSPPNSLEDLLDKLSLNSHGLMNQRSEPSKTKSKVQKNTEKLKILLESDTDNSPMHTQIAEIRKGKKEALSPIVHVPEKLSFEDLLDEDWSITDFAKEEEEGDLSDIVQAITGADTNQIATTVFELSSSSLESQTGTPVACAVVCHDSNHQAPSLSPSNGHDRELSFEEELPYTPLIDRVRKMRNDRAEVKRTSTAASTKLRRFSESFNAFCVGENATSSPIANISTEAGLNQVNFSLGISNILDSSK